MLLFMAVALYGFSLVLPNRIFDLSVEGNPKYATCILALSPGTACAPPVGGLEMECWSPRSLYPDRSVMDPDAIDSYCGNDWQEPKTLVEDGLSGKGVFGGSFAIMIGIVALIALAFSWYKHEAVAVVLSAIGVVLVFTFDNSQKVMDIAGTHILTGGHPMIGFYALQMAVVLLCTHFILNIVTSHGRDL